LLISSHNNTYLELTRDVIAQLVTGGIIALNDRKQFEEVTYLFYSIGTKVKFFKLKIYKELMTSLDQKITRFENSLTNTINKKKMKVHLN